MSDLVWIVVVVPALLAAITVFIVLIVKTPALMRTERTGRMRELARELGLRFYGDAGEAVLDALPDCSLLQRGRSRRVTNLLGDEHRPPRLVVFDYEFSAFSRDADGSLGRTLYLAVMARVPGHAELPCVRIFRSDWFGGPVGVADLYRIRFEDDPEFSGAFWLSGAEGPRVRRLLSAGVREAVKSGPERGPRPVVEILPRWVVVYAESDPGGGRLAQRGAELVRYALSVADALAAVPAG